MYKHCVQMCTNGQAMYTTCIHMHTKVYNCVTCISNVYNVYKQCITMFTIVYNMYNKLYACMKHVYTCRESQRGKCLCTGFVYYAREPMLGDQQITACWQHRNDCVVSREQLCDSNVPHCTRLAMEYRLYPTDDAVRNDQTPASWKIRAAPSYKNAILGLDRTGCMISMQIPKIATSAIASYPPTLTYHTCVSIYVYIYIYI